VATDVGAGAAAIAGGATYYSEYENSTTVERTETYDAETEGYDENNEYGGGDGQEGYGEYEGMYEDGEYGEYEYEGEYYEGEYYEGDEHAGDHADIMSAGDDTPFPEQQKQPSAGQEMSATPQTSGFESYATKEGYGQSTNDAGTSRATRNDGNGTASDEESGCCECGSCDCCGRCDCCGCCVVM
jgi:hypothetical protein